MTDKQEQILNAALELFAKDGFKATSTSKVAKRAGVSEGLIFRHFCNKDGLLQAILKEGEERVKVIFAEIIFETDPKELINKAFGMWARMIETQADVDFWKLQYKIKWELEVYDEHKMEPLELALANAFKKLAYAEPDLEAQYILIQMDGMATRFFLQKNFDLDKNLNFLRRKYKQ